MSHSKETLKNQNRLSLMFGAPGLVLQGIGGTSANAMTAFGTLLLVVGLGFYAKMKGRHPALGLVGVLSIVGLLVLYFVPTVCQSCGQSQSYTNHTCKGCGAPLKP